MRHLICLFFIFLKFSAFAQDTCGTGMDNYESLTAKDFKRVIVRLEKEHFETFADIRQVPATILRQFICLGDSLHMANPGEPYSCCCMNPQNLPRRRLQFFSISKNYFLIAYTQGGIGVSTQIKIYGLHNNQFADTWFGALYTAFKTPAALTAFMKSIRHPESWDWAHAQITNRLH